jgi:hypothetical protein
MALLKSWKLGTSAQMPHPPPTIAARQFRDELEDLVDRVVPCRCPVPDTSDQQPIKLRQPPELSLGFIACPIEGVVHTTHCA